MQFPVLGMLSLLPIAAGILLLLLPGHRRNLIRGIAFSVSLVTLLLTIYLFAAYDKGLAGYQFIEKMQWLPALGISYHMGVDGFSVPLELMAGSVFGVFASLDLFQLFFFFELAVFPKYLMIVMWGSPQTKEYGGMKLTLYLFLGSVVALVGVLAIYFASGLHSFDLLALEQAGFNLATQRLWFPFVFLGFAILGGLFPFHSWAPDGHVAAPTAVSMLLAGVEMKVGAFAALRVGVMLLPDGMRFWAPAVMVLATINVVYGAFIAMVQGDFKYVIGFSSVSHMGLVFIGFATLTPEGLTGAGLQMFSHGIMTALFFSVVGMVYDRTHTRDLNRLGGLYRHMPIAMIGFVVGGLVSMGMPGFSGFVAEIPIYLGAWKTVPLVAIVSSLSIVVTAAYILLVVRRVFFGETPQALGHEIKDISIMDKIVVVGLSLLMIVIGVMPSILVPMVESGVKHILVLLGGV